MTTSGNFRQRAITEHRIREYDVAEGSVTGHEFFVVRRPAENEQRRAGVLWRTTFPDLRDGDQGLVVRHEGDALSRLSAFHVVAVAADGSVRLKANDLIGGLTADAESAYDRVSGLLGASLLGE